MFTEVLFKIAMAKKMSSFLEPTWKASLVILRQRSKFLNDIYVIKPFPFKYIISQVGGWNLCFSLSSTQNNFLLQKTSVQNVGVTKDLIREMKEGPCL